MEAIMQLRITNNQFTKDPYILQTIDDLDLINNSPTFFDKDGYELTPIEQQFHHAQGVDLSEKHLYHTAHHLTWMEDTESSRIGVVMDHCLIATRWAYAGPAYEQLLRTARINPLLYKLLSIKPKWGIDISLDYVYNHGCIELFHIEYDFDNYEVACEAKLDAEQRLSAIDWEDAAKTVFKRKDEWQDLCSDDQADWKAKFFGWDRAFANLKVFKNE